MRRLNLGCGPVYREGFVNVDAFDRTAADLACDLGALALKDESFDLIEAVHVLEHLGYIRALAALSGCFRVLKPGARLVIETPDAERAFRAFLGKKSEAERASLLSWIFGLDAPGQQHRMLFPKELLEKMLRETGFRRLRFEAAATHLYREGIRVTAVRCDREQDMIAARLRQAAYGRGVVDAGNQLEALEFEKDFMGRVHRFHRAAGKPADLVLRNMVYSPAAVLLWLEAAGKRGPGSFRGWTRYRALALLLDETGFPARLTARFRDHMDNPPRPGDAYAIVAADALAFIKSIQGLAKGEAAQRILSAYPGLSDPRPAAFSRHGAESEVRGMRDRAVRLMAMGRTAEAARLLRLAVNSGIESFYPLVNYAILHAGAGKYGKAVRLYRVALAWDSGREMESFIREEIIKCLLQRRHYNVALEEAGDMGSRRLRGFWSAVVRLLRGEREAAGQGLKKLAKAGFRHALLGRCLEAASDEKGRPEPPPPRSRPVLAGELFHHRCGP
jgi:predicted SAM-dependent methyltransferase